MQKQTLQAPAITSYHQAELMPDTAATAGSSG
jgi:hypothetical protein